MKWFKQLRHRWRHYWPLSFAIGLIIYFLYHLVQGNHGILASIGLKKNLTEAEQQFEKEQIIYKRLEHSVRRLRPESLDRDLLEERARLVLNFVTPTEVIVLKKQ